MRLDEIEKLWHSEQNRPSPQQIEMARDQFVTALRKRSRGFLARMITGGVGLTLITAVLAKAILWPETGAPGVNLAREWAVLPLLALPWCALIFLLRQHRRQQARHPDYERSIGDSLRALRDQALTAANRGRTIILLHLISVPILGLCIQQIYQAGKARPHEVTSMIAAFAVIIVIAIGCLAFEVFRKRQEARRLETLLHGYKLAGEEPA